MRSLNQRFVLWTVFSVMAFTVPVVFFFVVQIAALIPLVAIITNVVSTNRGRRDAKPRFVKCG